MNLDYDTQLERAISRELKALPELAAPAALADRVLIALEQRRRLKWYQCSWSSWPVAIQGAALVLLLALFTAICLAGWRICQTDAVLFALRRAGEWCAGVSAVGTTLNALGGAGILVAKKLGSGFMLAFLAALGMGYALCVGLGTVYLRLAFVKR
jgi:hypothetical protein